ncbi:MAG: GntR family transcriptional regulator [Candidatus Brachytrichaceae bacterium NZ_4S206]|jgi:DNA-binding GntR family transcriptional regulator
MAIERVQHVSLTDQVYNILKQKILRRDVQPNEKLDVNGLASQLGVSRMPVVEALTWLESEGLVEKRDRVGTFVVPIDERKFTEWFEVRGMIEDWAAPRIAARVTKEEIAHLSSLLAEGRRVLNASQPDTFDFYSFIEIYDTSFHIALLRVADNSFAVETFALIHSHARIGRSFIPRQDQLNACRRSQEGHELILEAVSSREATAIAKAMQIHRDLSLAATLAGFREAQLP